MIRSFWRLQATDPGFSSQSVVALDVVLPKSKYPSRDKQQAFFESHWPRLNSIGYRYHVPYMFNRCGRLILAVPKGRSGLEFGKESLLRFTLKLLLCGCSSANVCRKRDENGRIMNKDRYPANRRSSSPSPLVRPCKCAYLTTGKGLDSKVIRIFLSSFLGKILVSVAMMFVACASFDHFVRVK